MDRAVVLDSLKNLQSHALEKLASRNKYQQTGLATLRIKAVGIDSAPQCNMEIFLHESADTLQRRIVSELNLPTNARLIISISLLQ